MSITQEENAKETFIKFMQAYTNEISQFLLTFSYSFPFLLIHAAGVLLSILKRKQMGRAWIFSLAGFLLLLATSLIQAIYVFWLFFLMKRSSGGMDLLPVAAVVSSTLQTVLAAIGTILLIAAIFSKRPSSVPE